MYSEELDKLSSVKDFFWMNHATKKLEIILMGRNLSGLKSKMETR